MSCLQFVENFKAVSFVRQSDRQLSEFSLASVRFLSNLCQAVINDQSFVFTSLDLNAFYSCFRSFPMKIRKYLNKKSKFDRATGQIR